MNAGLDGESEQRGRWRVASVDTTGRLLRDGVDSPLDLVLRGAQQGASADFAVLALPDATRQLIARAVAGSRAEAVLGTVVDVRTDGHLLAALGHWITTPLTVGEVLVGQLSVGRVPGRPSFTDADSDLLAGFALHVSVALELDRMREDLGGDHVIGTLYTLGIGLQGLVAFQSRPEHRVRLSDYVERIDALVRTVRVYLNGNGHRGETAAHRLLTVIDAETLVSRLPVHVEFAGRLDLSADLVDRVASVVRHVLREVVSQASGARLRVSVLGGLVTVEITYDGRDPDEAATIIALARYQGVLRQTESTDGTHLTWTAEVL